MKKLKLIVINYLVEHLLVAVTEEEVLQLTGKNKLSKEEMHILKEEADALKDSLLWKFLKKELQWRANIRRGEHCTKPDDVIFGSAMYYNFELQEKLIDNLRNL